MVSTILRFRFKTRARALFLIFDMPGATTAGGQNLKWWLKAYEGFEGPPFHFGADLSAGWVGA